ncbi:DUF4235 domain-containing protein [Sediminivirga luteola]|uniref:DUF4235 domain-containing protein n=1 Tax=Sediminivirga luteola TaxID=1774748 RepID=A0A8J2TZB2_9MICO|nr:DUF4235 domain-containing protein [Sediminivirga luteola]MCI2265009.1 DUF4235 domain-containing protein [Sediminivirga luteola]GGA19384.1 hypothetical protein GCM10011333_23120 [Sediminivirga luteola]
MSQIAWRVVGTGGAALAGIAARKVLTKAWEKTTHRPAPVNPQQSGVGLPEALAWTIVSGVGIAVVQLLVERAAANFVRERFGEQGLPKQYRTLEGP